MSHLRTQIRNKAAALLTGLTTTGANVFPGRVYPLNDIDLPGICIYTEVEEVDEEAGKIAGFQHRRLTLTVQCQAKLTEGLYDTLDLMAEEVETALFADQFLGGLTTGLDLVITETEMKADLEQPVGETTLQFSALYMTEEGVPGSPA